MPPMSVACVHACVRVSVCVRELACLSTGPETGDSSERSERVWTVVTDVRDRPDRFD
jgi:hypothetical protein